MTDCNLMAVSWITDDKRIEVEWILESLQMANQNLYDSLAGNTDPRETRNTTTFALRSECFKRLMIDIKVKAANRCK